MKRPEERPVDFFKPEFDVSGWKDIAVPSSWQMQGYDVPVYSNQAYLFKRDWPRVMADLDAAVVTGVVAVVLPVHLPRGSTVPHDRLERLWASTMERGKVVYRGDEGAPLRRCEPTPAIGDVSTRG